MTQAQLQTIFKSLNLIFWGTIILILDLSISHSVNGSGFKIDFINDVIGAIMVWVGVLTLSKFSIPNTRYHSIIKLVIFGAILQLLLSIMDIFIFEKPEILNSVQNIVNIFIAYALVAFSNSMVIFSTAGNLRESQPRWQMAQKLFLWIYLVPSITLKVIEEFSLLFKQNRYYIQSAFSLGNTLTITFTIIIVSIPLIYGLYAIHSMKQELREQYFGH